MISFPRLPDRMGLDTAWAKRCSDSVLRGRDCESSQQGLEHSNKGSASFLLSCERSPLEGREERQGREFVLSGVPVCDAQESTFAIKGVGSGRASRWVVLRGGGTPLPARGQTVGPIQA